MSRRARLLREADRLLRQGAMKLAEMRIPGRIAYPPCQGHPDESACADASAAEFFRLYDGDRMSRELAIAALRLRNADGGIFCKAPEHGGPEVACKLVIRVGPFDQYYDGLDEVLSFIEQSVCAADGSIKAEPSYTGAKNRNIVTAHVLHALIVKRDLLKAVNPEASMDRLDTLIKAVGGHLLRSRNADQPMAWADSQDGPNAIDPVVTAMCLEPLVRAGLIPEDEAREAFAFILGQQRKEGRSGSWDASFTEQVGSEPKTVRYNSHYYIVRALCTGLEFGLIGERAGQKALEELLEHMLAAYRPESGSVSFRNRYSPVGNGLVTKLAQDMTVVKILTIALGTDQDRYSAWRYTTWPEPDADAPHAAPADRAAPQAARVADEPPASRLNRFLDRPSVRLSLAVFGIVGPAIAVSQIVSGCLRDSPEPADLPPRPDPTSWQEPMDPDEPEPTLPGLLDEGPQP